MICVLAACVSLRAPNIFQEWQGMNLINDNSCFSPLFIKKLANQGTVYILRDTRRSSHIPYIKNSSQKKNSASISQTLLCILFVSIN